MSQIQLVKEAVKEAVVGSGESTQISAQTRAHFLSNAVKDPETGELYMGNDEFIDAVAPKSEDFVSQSQLSYLPAPEILPVAASLPQR